MKRPAIGFVEARASIAGYIVLSGIWWALGASYLWLVFARPTSGSMPVVAVCWTIGMLWIIWLRGFRLRIQQDLFQYRDGFYRTHSCRLVDIKSVRTQWISWRLLWRVIKVPRMVLEIEGSVSKSIVINIKPFSRIALAQLKQRVETVRV